MEMKLSLNKAVYKSEDTIVVTVQAHPLSKEHSYQWIVFDLHETIREATGVLKPDASGQAEDVIRIEPLDGSGAYGIAVYVRDGVDNLYTAEAAFDMVEHWREAPRYGFLTDFEPGNFDDSDIEFLRRHHINIVQYYDWMFRHDQLLPEAEDVFIEPLGRRISLDVVRNKIEKLQAVGMDSIAYAAIYASLKDYAEQHPEELLYNNDREPYKLGDYYYIMDISENSSWTNHILAEFEKVIDFGFHGLHLDQYGFPKKAIRKVGSDEEVVSLKNMYPTFINAARESMPEAGLIFNNVSSYPVHTTARTNQDVIYIEVWDPVSSLADIKQLIDRARELSQKQVVLAAYLPCFQSDSGVELHKAEIGARVTMATIFASGGYHLLLGEHENVLADSYYPNYGAISADFKQSLTKFYDFIVMYRHLLFDLQLEDISMTFAGGINTEVTFYKDDVTFSPVQQLDSVWNIVKERPGYTVIHLVNLCGLDNDIWHEGNDHPPEAQKDIEVRVEMLEDVKGIYVASPDGNSILPTSLGYDWVDKAPNQGKCLRFTVPSVQYWTMVYICTDHAKAGALTPSQ